jgi:hypothetical protein
MIKEIEWDKTKASVPEERVCYIGKSARHRVLGVAVIGPDIESLRKAWEIISLQPLIEEIVQDVAIFAEQYVVRGGKKP